MPPKKTKKANPEFAAELVKAFEEIKVLTFKKDELSAKELLELSEYAKKRTDINKKEKDLSPEQKAWKVVYDQFDELLKKTLKEEDKAKIDNWRENTDKLNKLKSNVERLNQVAIEIENLFANQGNYLSLHFNKEENYYKVKLNELEKLMLNEEVSISDRLKIAEAILKVVDVYREKFTSKISEYQKKIVDSLEFAQTIYKDTPFDGLDEDQNTQQYKKHFKEWLQLCTKLSQLRDKVVLAIKNHVETDEILPKFLIENGGDLTKKINAEEITRKGTMVVFMVNSANEEEKKLDETKKPIAEFLFGKPESYLKSDTTESTTQPKVEKPMNPLESKAWFRACKVFYILGYGLALMIPLFALVEEETTVAFWAFIVVIGIFSLIKKAFFYIALGKRTN